MNNIKKRYEILYRYPESEIPLQKWYMVTKKHDGPALATSKNRLIQSIAWGINICIQRERNDFRLVVIIQFTTQTVLIRCRHA